MCAERFNPQEQFEELRGLKGAQRKEAYDEFLEKRTKQREGIATLTGLMIETIEADPEIKIDDLYEMVNENSDELQLAPYQRRLAFKLVKEFDRRHQKLLRLEKDKTPEELFKMFFGFLPKGKVKLERRPINFNFILGGQDYDAILNKDAAEKKDRSAGRYFPNHEIVSIARSSDEPTARHEETHALKNLYEKVLADKSTKSYLTGAEIKKLSNQIMNTKDLRARESILRRFYHELIANYGEDIKNEIFAFFRGGDFTKKSVKSSMTRRADAGGLYDYLESPRNKVLEYLRNTLKPGDFSEIENYFNRIAKDIYREQVAQAIESFSRVLESGESVESAISLFMDIPLENWSKEERRLSKK